MKYFYILQLNCVPRYCWVSIGFPVCFKKKKKMQNSCSKVRHLLNQFFLRLPQLITIAGSVAEALRVTSLSASRQKELSGCTPAPAAGTDTRSHCPDGAPSPAPLPCSLVLCTLFSSFASIFLFYRAGSEKLPCFPRSAAARAGSLPVRRSQVMGAN